MNNKQQKLYDKLLKKVNEYCLGAAAEDVIAAIDALVDSYETPKVDLTSKPLEALDSIIETFIDKDSEDIKTVRTALKALEIIFVKEVDIQWLMIQFEGADIEGVIKYVTNFPTICSAEPLTAEEIMILKEIRDESTN